MKGFFFFLNKEKAVYFVFKLVFEKSKILWIHSASNIAFMQYILVSSFTKSTNNEIRYKRRIYLKKKITLFSFVYSMNRKSFFGYYEVIITVGVYSTIKL